MYYKQDNLTLRYSRKFNHAPLHVITASQNNKTTAHYEARDGERYDVTKKTLSYSSSHMQR